MSRTAPAPALPHLHHVAELTFAKDWHLPPHRHGFHELICLQTGEIETRADSGLFRGGAGDWLVYPAGQTHEEWARRAPLRIWYVAWDGDPPPAARGEVRLGRDSDGRVAAALSWTRDLRSSGGRDAALAAPLLQVLAGTLRAEGDDAAEDRWRLVRSRIQARLGDALSLDDLARWSGFSRDHFIRQFRRRHGLTPMAYVRQCRVERACALLRQTRQPLRLIAAQVGLGDEFQLSHLLRRHTRQTSRDLRGSGSAAQP